MWSYAWAPILTCKVDVIPGKRALMWHLLHWRAVLPFNWEGSLISQERKVDIPRYIKVYLLVPLVFVFLALKLIPLWGPMSFYWGLLKALLLRQLIRAYLCQERWNTLKHHEEINIWIKEQWISILCHMQLGFLGAFQESFILGAFSVSTGLCYVLSLPHQWDHILEYWFCSTHSLTMASLLYLQV